MDFNKVPPHDLEAEQAVIGSMLTDKEAVISAIETLTDDDFYREDNKIIYSAIMNLYNRGDAIDIITLNINVILFNLSLNFLLLLIDTMDTYLNNAHVQNNISI